MLVFCWPGLFPSSGSFFLYCCSLLMGPRNPSPDPLSESESEEEENANYLNESSGEERDSSEEEDPVVSCLTPLESLAWQVKCLLKYSTTWKPLNRNSWL